MKKILALLLIAGTSLAVEPQTVNRSSFTKTNNESGYIAANYLDKVIVGVATTGGALLLYNSTWTASVLISSISLGSVGMYDFANTAVAGIYYVTGAATSGVTIIYKK